MKEVLNVRHPHYIPYFFDQTPRLLAARFVRLLFEGGYYLRAAFISLESQETSTIA